MKQAVFCTTEAYSTTQKMLVDDAPQWETIAGSAGLLGAPLGYKPKPWLVSSMMNAFEDIQASNKSVGAFVTVV